jgi:hypothetical protein
MKCGHPGDDTTTLTTRGPGNVPAHRRAWVSSLLYCGRGAFVRDVSVAFFEDDLPIAVSLFTRESPTNFWCDEVPKLFATP